MTGSALERYGRFWEAQLRTAWGSSHLDRVALVEQGSVTSSAKRYDLSARIEGRIRRVLGIGAVFTSPARRGRGGARRLLQMLLDAAEADGYEYAMLFSEIDPAFYEQLDFVPVPLLESRLEVTRRSGAPAVLLRAGDDRDIPSVVEMAAARATGARLALDRSDDWVRFGLAKRRLLAGLGPADLRATEVSRDRRRPPGGRLCHLDRTRGTLVHRGRRRSRPDRRAPRGDAASNDRADTASRCP